MTAEGIAIMRAVLDATPQAVVMIAKDDALHLLDCVEELNNLKGNP